MDKNFEAWWETYIKNDNCKLKKTEWSFFEIGIIKEAMEDAFLHRKVERERLDK